jgi:hypothetical protein
VDFAADVLGGNEADLQPASKRTAAEQPNENILKPFRMTCLNYAAKRSSRKRLCAWDRIDRPTPGLLLPGAFLVPVRAKLFASFMFIDLGFAAFL